MMSHFETIFLRLMQLVTFLAMVSCSSLLAEKPKCNCKNDANVELAAIGKNIEDSTRTPSADDPRKYLAELDRDQNIKEMWPDLTKEKFSAVQTIVCGDLAATAIVACDRKTIITNAHMVINPQGKRRWDPNGGDKKKDCYFLAEDKSGKKMDYNIELPDRETLLKQVGSAYPGSTNQTATDWAVLKLENEVPESIVPMKIAGVQSSEEILNKQQIFVVSHFGDMKPNRAYTICSGAAQKTQKNEPYIETDCRSYGGASGGALALVKDKEPLLTMINARGSKKETKTMAVPVQGKFLETLLKMSDSENCVVPVEGNSKQASLFN